MLTSKPKNKIKRLLPENAPAELFQLDLAGTQALASAQTAMPPLPPTPLSAPPQPDWVRAVRADVARLPEEARVKNIVQLRKLLRRALLVEHTTIPPYLCALYTLMDGSNDESVQVIRSVVVEEMLHMILAANVLNAIGGEPSVNEPRFIPTYPSCLTALLNTQTDMTLTHLDDLLKVDALTKSHEVHPGGAHEGLEVNLLKFSPEAIDTFLLIEQPQSESTKLADEPTIGSFYKLIIDGLESLEAEAQAKGETIFTQDPERQRRQITPGHYYGSGGHALVVTDLYTARAALQEIVFQGEGFDPKFYEKEVSLGDFDEIGHYYSFNEIKQGRYYERGDTPKTGPRGASLLVDWTRVYPMKPNPTLKDYRHDPQLLRKGKAFNQAYLKLLDKMQIALTGQPDALQEAVVFMFELKYLAAELVRTPLGDGDLNAGPIFGSGS